MLQTLFTSYNANAFLLDCIMPTSTLTFTPSELITHLKPAHRFATPMPFGSSDALLLAQLAQAQSERRAQPLVVFCANAQDVARLQAEVVYFHPSLRVLQLPDWETLPYDQFSPHHDLVSERLQTLYALTQRQ